ncbi:MAG: Rieske 2Fe-2S domain-containing protein [Solirubrobacterales bacterium]
MADSGTDTSTVGGEGPTDELPEMKPVGYFEGESMTRRKVFAVAGQALGGAAGLAVALPAIGFAVAPIFDKPEEDWQAVGEVQDFVPDTYKARVITIVQGIGEAGKTSVYVRQGSPDLLLNEATGEHESADQYIAISTRCAHLGCPVRFVQAAGNFICPCHGGVYGFQGEVIGGPPVRPLDRFQTRVVDGTVEIGPRYSVTSSLEPVRARDPGEFTGGIWEFLYPPRPSTAPPPSS